MYIILYWFSKANFPFIILIIISLDDEGKCRLVVNSPSVGDSGQYSCVAQNATWKDEISAFVVVPGMHQHQHNGMKYCKNNNQLWSYRTCMGREGEARMGSDQRGKSRPRCWLHPCSDRCLCLLFRLQHQVPAKYDGQSGDSRRYCRVQCRCRRLITKMLSNRTICYYLLLVLLVIV